MKMKYIPIFLLSTLLLTGCNFKYSYRVKGVTYDVEGGGSSGSDWDSGIDDSGSYKIKIWVAETVLDITKSQVSTFKALNSDKYSLDIEVAKMDEPDAAAMMKQDVSSGADIYCFATDQLAALKKANALAKMPTSLATILKGLNTEDSVEAASIDDDMWAMPATSDNGYLLYYNKSILSSDDIKNVSTILSKSQAASKKFFFDATTNGYYGAAYYLGAGCHSTWYTDTQGRFIRYDDDINSDKGLYASKGLKELYNAGSTYRSGHDASRLGNDAAAVVSGVWDYNVAHEALGDDLGCAELPSYTVDGVTTHLGSFSGYKLFGVKPQGDAKKLSVCRKLALYLTGEQSQKDRFNQQSWGPTNKVAAAMEAVQNNAALKALREQQPYSTIQAQCPGAWFNALVALSGEIKTASSDADYRTALQTYEDGLEALLEED